jgi:exosortase A-associated hydrolase 1
MEPYRESAVAFDCDGEHLIGIIAAPEEPKSLGVVIVVGGPQYRAGSHRQFTALARRVAASGFAALRFDYRGMGDSTGAARTFEDIDSDIRAAIDVLIASCPHIRTVALWGLCDAASAAMMYVPSDPRVVAIALANPWARGEQTLARTQLKHYYLQRVLSTDFWRKVFAGRFSVSRATGDLRENVRLARTDARSQDFRARMTEGLRSFGGAVLLIIATADLTANEFVIHAETDPSLRELIADNRVVRRDVAGADHTFSRAQWQLHLESVTTDWLTELCAS